MNKENFENIMRLIKNNLEDGYVCKNWRDWVTGDFHIGDKRILVKVKYDSAYSSENKIKLKVYNKNTLVIDFNAKVNDYTKRMYNTLNSKIEKEAEKQRVKREDKLKGVIEGLYEFKLVDGSMVNLTPRQYEIWVENSDESPSTCKNKKELMRKLTYKAL